MQRSFGKPADGDSSLSSNQPKTDLSSKEAEQFDKLTASELAKREGILEERERLISEHQKVLEEKLTAIESLRKDLILRAEKISKMNSEDAQKILLEQLDKELSEEASKKIREKEEEIKAEADEKAKQILADAMLHGVTDYVAEFTTSTVKLPDEEMKGRIIGKEGRNIKAFEQSTGVDVLMDEDTPDVITISSFDPVRREIAKVSLERLMADGRIQPERIEEIVKKTQDDIERIMLQTGEKLCHDLEIYNMPTDVMALLGRFKYRYSYGQNLIQHSMEVAQIAGGLAAEIGANASVAKLGGLLHDIGKILTDWDEGTHVERGVQLAKKFNFPQEVIDCIAQHHEDEPFSSAESICVYLGDAISGGRPGARHENVQDYFKRISEIERIATSFEEVEKAFAIQAGREVRVIVFPDKVSDDEMPKLVHDIGERIQKEVMVPGAVKITAVREVRVSDSFLTSGG